MNREYPAYPICGVGAVVFKDEHILIVKRKNPPLKDEWSIPGGKQKNNESLMEAVVREVKEECEINIVVVDLVDIFEYIEFDKNKVKYHYVVFDFVAFYTGGILKAKSDAIEAKWIKISELDNYNLKKETEDMILKSVDLRKRYL